MRRKVGRRRCQGETVPSPRLDADTGRSRRSRGGARPAARPPRSTCPHWSCDRTSGRSPGGEEPDPRALVVEQGGELAGKALRLRAGAVPVDVAEDLDGLSADLGVRVAEKINQCLPARRASSGELSEPPDRVLTSEAGGVVASECQEDGSGGGGKTRQPGPIDEFELSLLADTLIGMGQDFRKRIVGLRGESRDKRGAVFSVRGNRLSLSRSRAHKRRR